jgi:hypothetical protein
LSVGGAGCGTALSSVLIALLKAYELFRHGGQLDEDSRYRVGSGDHYEFMAVKRKVKFSIVYWIAAVFDNSLPLSVSR